MVQTLTSLITKLQKLEAEGHGNKKVFYRDSRSGDSGSVSSAFVTDYVSDEGPFDIEDGEFYIQLTLDH